MHRFKRIFPSQAASILLGLTLSGSVRAQEAPLIPSLTGAPTASLTLPPAADQPMPTVAKPAPQATQQPTPTTPPAAPAAQTPGTQAPVLRTNKVVIPIGGTQKL